MGLKATSRIRPFSTNPGAELSRNRSLSGVLSGAVGLGRITPLWSVLISVVICCAYIKVKPSSNQALYVRTRKILQMSKKGKLGRPPLPKGASRGARLFCRLLPSEIAEIEAAAKNAKRSKSEWIRDTLLTAARRTSKSR